jgi:archaellum component FlaC
VISVTSKRILALLLVMVILVPTVNASGAASLAPTATVTSKVITDFNSLISNVGSNATVVDYEALAERLMFQLEKGRERVERAFEDRDLEIPEAARDEYSLGVEALNETRELISSGDYQAAAQVARGALNHFGNAYRIFREHIQATEEPEETDEPTFNETERGLKVAIERAYMYLGRLNATVVSLEGEDYDVSAVLEMLRKAWTYMVEAEAQIEEGELRNAARALATARETLGQSNGLMNSTVKAYKERRVQQFMAQVQNNIRNINGTIERLQTSLEAGRTNQVRAVLSTVEMKVQGLQERLTSGNLDVSLDELHAAVNSINDGLNELDGETATQIRAMNMVEAKMQALNASAIRISQRYANYSDVQGEVDALLSRTREMFDEITDEIKAGNTEAVRDLLRIANSNVVEANKNVRRSIKEATQDQSQIRPGSSSQGGTQIQEMPGTQNQGTGDVPQQNSTQISSANRTATNPP